MIDINAFHAYLWHNFYKVDCMHAFLERGQTRKRNNLNQIFFGNYAMELPVCFVRRLKS